MRSSGVMHAPIPICDARDPRLADYASEDARARRREIERAAAAGGWAVCEGPTVVRRALESGFAVRSVLVTPQRLETLADALTGLEAPVYVAGRALMEEVVGYAFHRGALASVARPAERPLAELLEGASRLGVCEGITDHENLGSIFRNAAAFGIDAVLLDPTSCDPLYRRAIRVSMGYVLRVPFGRVAPWPDALDELSARGFRLAALTPGAGSVPLEEVTGDRLAMLLGTEGPGLTDVALARADVRVRIAMRPGVDSLNVAATSALAFRAIAGDGLV
jgi:tRNA G18 (ribose-2'-O)-methylase SpoU